ncbi:sensor histidine kinase [Clostridium perfringens]|uniref:HAMP domain-containing sensor histidine kinase n=1 Tax=Clostridium perfringens TaxID=1502 RepID=UPI000D50E60F|nr:HAMP domain-containing sensor histidine kinase [Clostridium perfringens]PVE14628.1 sensor histidine kinase [Clostridium perfringens]
MKKFNLGKNRYKVSNILLRNYLKVFLLITIITATIFLISFIIGVSIYLKSEPIENESSKILVGEIENKDYNSIGNQDYVTEHGGWIEIIDKDLNVIETIGDQKVKRDNYSSEEFSKILVDEMHGVNIDENYLSYTGYSKEGRFFVITRIPEENFGKMFTRNPKIGFKIFVYIMISLYIFIFTMSLILYSKLTSKTFTKPLDKLMNGVRKLSLGDYSTRINIEKNNEFEELGEAFNNMASKIEEEKKLKEKSEKLRKEFVRNIAHDLKTPLSSIIGYSNIIKNNPDIEKESLHKYISVIENNGERANEMIMELFEFYTLQSSEFILHKKYQDLSEFLRNLIADYIYLLEEKDFDFDFEISEDDLYLEFDNKRLERAIGNLIINSVKYNKKGTKFLISLKKEGDKVKIIVSDDGIGLSEEIKKHIFNPFVREEKSRNSKKGGSGLGLTISKEIVEKHGGTIYLSDGPLKGCNFVIELPIK